jgi:3-mercaptopyruvate sulfurtransferase SseA
MLQLLQSNYPTLKVLDCSSILGKGENKDFVCRSMNFHKAHIKGAQYLDLDSLAEQKTELMMMLPTPAHFSSVMRKLGVKLSDHIVCYDTIDKNAYSYRAKWMF